MKRRILALCLLASAGFLLSFTSQNRGKYFEISKNIEIYTNVYKELNTWYVDDLDPATIMRTGIDAMVGSLDPFTNYFSESQIEGYRYLNEGKFDGVGADFKIIDGYPTIVEPNENSPAIKAGLKAGDQIIAINGEPAQGRSIDDVHSVVRGVPGTTLQLRIKRPGQNDEIDVNLTRGEVSPENVPYSGFVADGIGYIALTTFTQDAGRNVANALRNLKTGNPDIKGLIFDLRGNGGGLLREAVNVSNVFVGKDEMVVSTRGKVPERDQMYSTKNNPVDEDIPLVILIDKNSASASEIVSGVVQDFDRGVLLGQRSYGKGLVQNTRDVGYNAKLKMTTAKYYIPSGRCIQSVEYENGEPKDITDDKRAKFKTRNGRTVLDGGGVSPDVVIEKKKAPEIVQALNDQHLIFNYVTQFCLDHPEIAGIEQFTFSDYDDFVRFVNKSDFIYDMQAEETVELLSEQLAEAGLSDELKADLKTLERALDDEKANHLQKYRDEIIHEIEMDIAGRYYFQTGQTQQRLKNDPELQEAIALLNDQKKYADKLK